MTQTKDRETETFSSKKYKRGLVLSGGGARGIAHLGAVKALYEKGLTFDIIIGTSVGAIVGCLLADGRHPDEILKVLTQNRLRSFIRPGFSLSGLMTMRGVRKALQKMLSVANLEDLTIPCIVVATDLDRGKTHYFEQGDIIDAVTASASIPVVFQPVVIDGSRYIDGSILNGLSVRHIRNDCEKIIGLHVNSHSPEHHNREKVKGIVNIACRVFHLRKLNNILPDVELCDFYLEHTNLQKYAAFDFSKATEIFQIGYDNTVQLLQTDYWKLV